jgi:glycosyltransferase 2 family protein
VGETAKVASGGRVVPVLRWAAFGACVLLFASALARTDLAGAWHRIKDIGLLSLLVVVPFPFAMGMDAWAWRGLLRALDRKVPWSVLFTLRIGTEAVTNSAPAGAVWADAISPLLVSQRTGIPAVDVFAASTAKRWTVVRMHGAYVSLCSAFGATALVHASGVMFKSDVLLVATLGAAVFLVFLSIAIEMLAAHGRVAGRLSAMLERARFERIRAWVEERRHHFARADQQLARLSKNKRAGAAAAWRMLGLWLFEGLESYLILHLLGAPLTVIEVLSIDAALSVVRSSAMFTPAGIGVQDVGYLAMLEAYGVPDAASLGPAFIVLKRVKEAFWIVIGFAILARPGPRALLLHPDRVENEAQLPPQEPPAAT